jgi:tetratricopeptide (TPR) repeat protein
VRRLLLGVAVLTVLAAAGFGYAASRIDANYHALLVEGDAAAARGDYVAAVEAFSGAIAWKPDAMAAHLKRGEAYRRREDYETAMRDLRRAAELDPTAPRPRELLGDVSYAMERYARAAERYTEYIALDDSSPRLHYKLALAQYRGGQPAACVDALAKGIGLDAQSAEAHYLMGLCLQEGQRPREALAAFERAVSLNAALLQNREELAEEYARLGRPDDQITQLVALLAHEPGPSREVALGLAYATAGDHSSAVEALSRTARRYPAYRYTYVALGRVWLEQAEARNDRVALGKALEALQQAVGADDNSEALALLGRARLRSDELEQAERVLQEATQKLPVDSLAFFYLAEAADRLGHLEVAREALLDYCALDEPPDQRTAARIWLRIGDLSARLQDMNTALTYYTRALPHMNEDPAGLVRVAEAQFRAGKTADALTTLDRALAKDPGNAAGLALRRKLHGSAPGSQLPASS